MAVGLTNICEGDRAGTMSATMMVALTIYGALSTAEAMIARVRRMHERVAGRTPSGETYCASDSELLNWVHGTAAYGFLQAYHAYVQPLSSSERDRYYAEGVTAAGLYGATNAPTSEAELEKLFMQRPIGWSAPTLCLNFSRSCARRLFCRCC
jgi:uncharacterized protein (DUF2236 family)